MNLPAPRAAYLSWIEFQRRPVSMQDNFGFSLRFLPVRWRGNKAGILAAYAMNFVASLRYLHAEQPDAIWVQVPQYPALWAAMLYRRLVRRPVALLADCHNSVVWAPWNRFPFGPSSLARCDLVLVHNQEVRADAKALGVPDEKLFVLEDAPTRVDQPAAEPDEPAPHPWFLFPASWAHDEPIEQVIEAARQMPEATFMITGDRARYANQAAVADERLPPNLRLLGFLPLAAFDQYFTHADAILALTLEEGIQLSVCNEAVGFGKPMVCSDTRILRELFAQGTVFVQADEPASIVKGCVEALARARELAADSAAFGHERRDRWQAEQAAPVLAELARATDRS